jgi:hypothetical protein
MKIILPLIALFFSATSFGLVTVCNQPEKLQCTAQYLVRSKGALTTQTKTHTEAYQLESWDEPSLAYCQASTGFTDNKLDIRATMDADHQISVSIQRSSVGGVTFDKASNVMDASIGIPAQVHVSFSPEIDISQNDVAATLVNAEVSCRIVK